MEVTKPQVQTSFIPKATLREVATGRPSRSGIGFLSVLSIIIFLGAVISWGGAYAYREYIRTSTEELRTSLDNAREAFEPNTLRQFETLDRKILAAGKLLDSHVSLVPLFELLEGLTYREVRYKNFHFTRNGKTGTTVTLSGEARDYATVALQSDSLGQNEFIKNPIFSNLNLNNFGNVVFELTFQIDPALISYQEHLRTP